MLLASFHHAHAIYPMHYRSQPSCRRATNKASVSNDSHAAPLIGCRAPTLLALFSAVLFPRILLSVSTCTVFFSRQLANQRPKRFSFGPRHGDQCPVVSHFCFSISFSRLHEVAYSAACLLVSFFFLVVPVLYSMHSCLSHLNGLKGWGLLFRWFLFLVRLFIGPIRDGLHTEKCTFCALIGCA